MLYGLVLQVIVLLIIMSYLAVNSATSSDYVVKSLYLDGMLKQEDTLSKVIKNYKLEKNKIPQNLKELKENGYIDKSFTNINPFGLRSNALLNESFEEISDKEIAFTTIFKNEPDANLYKSYYKSKLNGYVPTCENKDTFFVCKHVHFIGE